MIKYTPFAAGTIYNAIGIAIKMAALADEEVILTFNDTDVSIYPSYASQIYNAWQAGRKS
jgi:hypothetical protein